MMHGTCEETALAGFRVRARLLRRPLAARKAGEALQGFWDLNDTKLANHGSRLPSAAGGTAKQSRRLEQEFWTLAEEIRRSPR
jgi:hypothetical protein